VSGPGAAVRGDRLWGDLNELGVAGDPHDVANGQAASA